VYKSHLVRSFHAPEAFLTSREKLDRIGNMSKQKPDKQKSGPKPETVKIDGDWEDSVATALQIKRPKEGWPKEK
jgi:hypothetical protein